MTEPDTARKLAERYLAKPLPRRWRHVQGVAARAERIRCDSEDSDRLVSACWLHDIGYAPALSLNNFHPLDGAIALLKWRVDSNICNLVAFHSAAEYEAIALGLQSELSQFTDYRSSHRDLLWYLDMTTSPDGDPVTFECRMGEIRDRYPADHYVIRALGASMAARRDAVKRAESWLSGVGLAGQV